MDKIIIFSLVFRGSFREIVYFIKKDSKNNAKKFRFEILEKISDLKKFNYIGKEISKDTYKYQCHKNFFLYYEITSKEIIILDIKHVKRKE